MPYTVEVQEEIEGAAREHPEGCGNFRVVGLMNTLFNTKKEAKEYVKAYTRNTSTGIDPSTGRRYIVRKYRKEILTLFPFSARDGPSLAITRDNAGIITAVEATYKHKSYSNVTVVIK